MTCEKCQAGKYTTDENNINCLNCAPGMYASLTGSSNCTNCPSGKYSIVSASTSEKNCLNCQKGKISSLGSTVCEFCPIGMWSNIKTQCQSCSLGKYSNILGLDSDNECKLCPNGKYNDVLGITTINDCKICENCPENSEQNYVKTSCVCSIGSYDLNYKTNKTIECVVCSDEFTCNKGTNIETLILKTHFWRANSNTIVTYKCKNIFACKGGLITNSSDDLCNEGHIGPLCDVCEEGWAKDDGVCLKCPEDTGRSIGLTIFIPVVCIVLIIFLIKTANPAQNLHESVLLDKPTKSLYKPAIQFLHSNE